jgi:hypothetical protein
MEVGSLAHFRLRHLTRERQRTRAYQRNQRAAFARKADWFRLLAQIKAKKEEAVATSKDKRPRETRPEAASGNAVRWRRTGPRN